MFAPLSLCLPFAIYFLATTRFNSKTSNLFPYLSSHCWSKNIEHILSFIHAPPSSFSFFSHSLSLIRSHSAYAAAAASLHSTQLSQFCLFSFVRLVTPSTRLPNRPPFSLFLVPLYGCHNVRPTAGVAAATVFVCDKVLNKHWLPHLDRHSCTHTHTQTHGDNLHHLLAVKKATKVLYLFLNLSLAQANWRRQLPNAASIANWKQRPKLCDV